jgi:hypothetical protein
MTETKPYRPNVGVALFNAFGHVLIGRRFRDDGPEIVLPGLEWQMPQGGIDANENPRQAAMRELWEETGAKHAEYLDETERLTYEFPPYFGPPSHRLRNSAASARNGSRYASPASTTRLIRCNRAMASRRNSTNGDGSASIASPISWCHSGARSIALWRGSSRSSPANSS